MDQDEEDVLYASHNDPGRERATLIGEGRKGLHEIFQNNTENLKQTLCFCAAFLGLGLSIAVVGPTLPDIMAQVDVHDYFKIAFIFAGRGLGHLGGFVFGNVFYSSFNPQSLIAVSLFLAAIAMGMVTVTKNLYVMVMIMSVVGFASGILQKVAKVVSLGIGKTHASGFFRLIYFAFALGAFISTLLLVIPFSKTDGLTTDDSNGTENTAENQPFSTINNTDRATREAVIHLESWTTLLNHTLSSLNETTDKFNETSDIFIFTQGLNETLHNMIASVCNNNGSSVKPSFREIIEGLDNLYREYDFAEAYLLNASAHFFKDTVSEISSNLTNAVARVAEIKTNAPLIFDKYQQRCFLKKICQNYTAYISSRVLKHVNGTLKIVLPATNSDENLTKKLESLISKLEEIVPSTNINLSNCGCNDAAFQILNSTSNTAIKILKTLYQSYKQDGVTKTFIRDILSQMNGHQTEIVILTPICICDISSESQNIDANRQWHLTLLEECNKILQINSSASNPTNINLTIAYNNDFSDIVRKFEKLLLDVSDPAELKQIQDELEIQNCLAINATNIGTPIHLSSNHNISTAQILKDVCLRICKISVSAISRDVTAPPDNAPVTMKTNAATNQRKRYVEAPSWKGLFDMTDSCNQTAPTIKYTQGHGDCFNLSVRHAEHLNSRESVNNLSLNVTGFRRTFKTMVAAETALRYIDEKLKHSQKLIDSMGEKIESILSAHNFDHEDICRFGLQSLVLNISRLNYCLTVGRGLCDINQNVSSLMHSLDTTFKNTKDLIVNFTYPLTEFNVARLSNISKNQTVFAGNLSVVASVLTNDTSVNYYVKVLKSICAERINKSVEEIKLNTKNIKRIAAMCVKESPTTTSSPLSTQPFTTTSSLITSNHTSTPSKTELPWSNRPNFTMVYVIIAAYLGLASLLFLVLVQIPPLPSIAPSEELSGDLKIELIAVEFFFHLLYTAAEVSFGAFVLVNYRSIFSSNSFVIVVLFWGSFALGRFISLFLSKVTSLTQYLLFSLAGNIVASTILVLLLSCGTYMFVLGTVVLGLSMSTLFQTGDRWLKGHISERCVSNTFKYLFVAGDALGGGVSPLLVGYFMGDGKKTVTTSLTYIISAINVMLLFLFAYAYSLTKGMNHPNPERGNGNQVENVVSTTLARVSKSSREKSANKTIYAQPKSKQIVKATKYKD